MGEKTVSMHVSKDKNAINTLTDLKRADEHNNRKYENAKEKGYDKSQNIELISGGTFIERYMEAVRKRITPEVLWDYNQGKPRNKQIDNVEQYIKKLSESRSQIAVEMIVQVGDRDMWREEQYSDNKDKMKLVYQDFLESYKKDNPNIEIISASIHFDEESPHMHLITVPFTDKNKIGLPIQVSKNQVYTRKYLHDLQVKGRAELEKSMKKHINPDFKLAEIQQGRNKDYHKDDYVKQINEYIENTGIDKIRESITRINNEHQELEKSLDSMIPFNKKKKVLDKLENFGNATKNLYENTQQYIKSTLESLNNLINNQLTKTNEIYLKTDNELFKLLNKKQKKEIADLIRNDYINTDEFNDFKERVIQDYKTATINKVERLNTQKKLLEELEIEKAQLLQETEKLENKKNGLLKDMTIWEGRIDGLKANHNKVQKDYETAIKIIENPKIQEDIKIYIDYKRNNTYLIEENKALEEQNKKLKEEKEETERQITIADNKIKALENNKMIEQYNELLKQLKDLEEQEEKKRKTIQAMEQEVKELEEKQREFTDLSNEIQGLKTERDNLNTEVKSLNKELESLENNKFGLDTENAVMLNEFDKFKSDMFDILDKIYPDNYEKQQKSFNEVLEYMINNSLTVNYKDMLDKMEERLDNNPTRDYEMDI